MTTTNRPIPLARQAFTRRPFLAFSLVAFGFSAIACGTQTKEHDHSGHDHENHQDHEAPHWSYTGETGPAYWGDLSPEFELCKTGLEQSPIDLVSSAEKVSGAPLSFSYQATALNLVNNGHTIQQNMAPGSFMSVGGSQYQLLQFHFHEKSEHTLDGKQQDLEVHLVHQSADGEYAVLGLFFKQGAENAFLKGFWEKMPTTAGEEIQDSTVSLDLNQLLPSNRAYFAYDGSFTTPPGTEGVKWHVFQEVAECSSEQLEAFRALHAGNFRPVQPLNSRSVQIRE